MPRYIYRVRDKFGKVIKGELAAQDPKDLRKKLDARGYFVIEFSEAKSAGVLSVDFLSSWKKVGFNDLSIVSWQLYTMLNAGLPLMNCLRILVNQTENEILREALIDIHQKVDQGVSFTEALKKHSNVFTNLYVQMVNAGEVGGVLDEMLRRLAIFYEKQAEIRSKIKSAMTYPAVLLIICLGVVIFLITFVLPRFSNMFDDLGTEIPMTTLFLLDLGAFIKGYWYVILIAFGILLMLFRNYIKAGKGRLQFDQFLITLPGLGQLIQKTTASQFTQTLSTLVGAGIPILTTLDVVIDTVDNSYVAKALREVTSRVGQGKSIAEPLRESGIFPDMVVNMINVGEETGALENILTKVSDFYEREVNEAINAFAKVIEPILIVVMTLLVGFIAVSIFLPMTEIMEGVQH